MRILFVCTGNTCRSPMAEAILKDISDQRGLNIEVDSAGLFAVEDQAASLEAIEIVDNQVIKNHRSKMLTKELVDWSQLILVMTKSHLNMLRESYPQAKKKAHLLLDYSGYGNNDIRDPFGASLEEYKRVKLELEDAIYSLLEKI